MELADLEKRVSVLEEKIKKYDSIVPVPKYSEGEAKSRKGIEEIGITSYKYLPLTPDFYFIDFHKRIAQVNLPTFHHMCKSILLINQGCRNKDCSVIEDSLYYLVILSYMAKLSVPKINRFVRDMTKGPKKAFRFTVASNEDSETLTGYKWGGVSPFGMNVKIPILFDKALYQLNPPNFIIGGGDILRVVLVNVEEFVAKVTPLFVGDVSTPRCDDYIGVDTGGDDESAQTAED